MAEALLNHIAGDRYSAHSAGLEPGILNPLAVKVMAERGVDIAHNAVKSISSLLLEERNFDIIITVCDGANAERCPVIPGFNGRKLHWEFNDPSALTGTEQDKLSETRRIRDEIHANILDFITDTQAEEQC